MNCPFQLVESQGNIDAGWTFRTVMLLTECLPSWLVLPTDFSSLGAIVAKCVEGELSHFAAVLIGYLAVDIGLIFILYRIALHTDFAFFDQK